MFLNYRIEQTVCLGSALELGATYDLFCVETMSNCKLAKHSILRLTIIFISNLSTDF